jgi:hypothetical protein
LDTGRREDRREAEVQDGRRPEGRGDKPDSLSGATNKQNSALTLQDGQGLQDKEKVIKEKEPKRKL